MVPFFDLVSLPDVRRKKFFAQNIPQGSRFLRSACPEAGSQGKTGGARPILELIGNNSLDARPLRCSNRPTHVTAGSPKIPTLVFPKPEWALERPRSISAFGPPCKC